jgi:hypothetical protein
MNKIFFISLGYCLLILFGCNYYCKGKKIPIGLLAADNGDNLNLYVGSKLVAHRDIKKTFITFFRDKTNLLTEVCVENDSILVKAVFNTIDTSFYLNPKEVNECYIGKDVTNHILVFYNYVDGGYRKYSPVR